MSDDENASPGGHDASRCAWVWCTTPHGETVHEADEDHRSAGCTAFLVRRGDGAHAGIEVEVGLLRRRTDAQTWLVVEDGRGIHVEIAVESARDLLRALSADPAVARELGLAVDPGQSL
ncbi:hypothetical protein ACFXQA_15135 [Microbacterium sp. P07]|uniref:hypothetical protein n=1 Tax=Microbacterium sp. P07 TaxID=3366952 RepID=UPI0037473A9D